MLSHLFCYAMHQANFYSIQTLHLKIFQSLFKGTKASQIQTYAAEFVEQSHFLLYPPAIEALQKAQSHGHHTAILSSSPDFLVSRWAQKLNVSEWRATEYVVDEQNRFCSISSLMLSEGKVAYLVNAMQQKNVPKEYVTAYSDSILDLTFLESAGTAIAVNPDRKLKKICNKRAWKIL